MLDRLQKVEQLARAGKWQRLGYRPGPYLFALLFKVLVYPLTRRGILARARTFFGKDMLMVLPAATDIYLTGGKTHASELRLARFMIRNLQIGDFFLDIGAHYGYFSLLAAVLTGPEGQVCAFEASESTFQLLQKNTRDSGNIRIFHRAMSDAPGRISFYEFPVLFSEYNTTQIDQFEGERWYRKYQPKKTEVDATTIDDFLVGESRLPDMIKIDVEGAEHLVIPGGARTFSAAQAPVLVMEYLEASRGNAAHRKADAWLRQHGYQAYCIVDDGALQPVSDIQQYLSTLCLDSDNIVYKK